MGKANGPYQRYSVQFAVDTRDLNCPSTADGAYHCAMEAVIFVYDGDGTLEIMQFAGLKADLPADKYTLLLQAGFRFHQEISVPVKGEYFCGSACTMRLEQSWRSGDAGCFDQQAAPC